MLKWIPPQPILEQRQPKIKRTRLHPLMKTTQLAASYNREQPNTKQMPVVYVLTRFVSYPVTWQLMLHTQYRSSSGRLLLSSGSTMWQAQDLQSDHEGDMINMVSIIAGVSCTPAPALAFTGHLSKLSTRFFLSTSSDVAAVKNNLAVLIGQSLKTHNSTQGGKVQLGFVCSLP